MTEITVATTVAALRDHTATWRAAGERIALVPTMGALHPGHIALVEKAASRADRVIVSIFVNPTQFAPHEDFASYPRDLTADLATLNGKGVSLVYAPERGEMYPDGASTVITVGGPAEGLESDTRPHFFAGVATVVSKLLIQCGPDVAVFGEKDFQQLAVVRRLVRDLSLPVEIIGLPTVREPSRLARSSRNAYFSEADRARAAALYAALSDAARAIAAGKEPEAALAVARVTIKSAGFALDYLELRDEETLGACFADKPLRLLVAARLAGVRLIDNVRVTKA
ncbi:pantoate--beta-alanine ligase [Hansschlegelia quercus]|uniref:Pantothenate synthetase n=1 Tax=Hansschlegelia quercus TaxID=2528245 RepID=A0A4Q9GLZ6_9HYPH|nr:pantoate--beta-alanine ligase [Hansschlegelia quercus]TBN54125.1 pantoate--beta-alanine ligase [Hansschlegelia quercus]